MCMIISTLAQRIPRKAILGTKTVYKVMKVLDPNSNLGKYAGEYVYSPHRSHPYLLGHEQRASIRVERQYRGDNYGETIVTTGIHSFPNQADAEVEMLKLRRNQEEENNRWWNDSKRNDTFAVYECEIPRGSKYYVGYWEFHYPDQCIPNIVSDRLTIVKKVAE